MTKQKKIELVEAGPLRSERELTRFLQIEARCPACGGLLVTQMREELLEELPHWR